MALMHHEQGKDRIVALCVALLLLIQAPVMPGPLSDGAPVRAGNVSGSCLPSCEPVAGAFFQRAAVLPVAAPAVPEPLKRHQYDGPDHWLQDAWQESSTRPGVAPHLNTSAGAHSGRNRSGSGKLCTLLCTYRL